MRDQILAVPNLQIDRIDGVAPLDAQLGVADPRTVPDMLFEPLFGQPKHTKAALSTFAILDAAKMPSLPELLEMSGLQHRCLFKGDAYDELKNVAPWIVRLEDDNTFTRNLFTRSGVPWHFWDSEPGIYIRSGGTLDDMWKHFRKFTRMQDEKRKWYFLRFWDPTIWFDALTLEGCELAHDLLSPSHGSGVDCLVVYTATQGSCMVVRPPTVGARHMGKNALAARCLTQADVEILRIGMLCPFAREILTQIARDDAAMLAGLTKSEAETRILATVMRLHGYGFLTVDILRELCLQDLFLGYDFESEDETGQLMQICRSNLSEAEKYLGITKRISALELVKYG